MSALMSQLAAVQQRAATWVSNPPQEATYSMRAQDPLTVLETLPFGDQVWLVSSGVECG